jgi:hypothetical protein
MHKCPPRIEAGVRGVRLAGRTQHPAKQMQEERDEKKLKSKAVTKRDKRLLRARQAEASAPPV